MVPDPRSIPPPVLLLRVTVTVFAAVTWADNSKSWTSKEKEALAKSPSAAPVTVISSASSSPSAILPQSFVSVARR